MSKIQTITKYTYKGVEYKNLKDIKSHVEDIIGSELLDKVVREIDIRHKDILKLFEIIIEPKMRAILLECLSVEFETPEDEDNESKTINILDLK